MKCAYVTFIDDDVLHSVAISVVRSSLFPISFLAKKKFFFFLIVHTFVFMRN